MTTAMTKGERDQLLSLVKARARVAKAGIDQRKAELVADFEQQLAAQYLPSDHPAWQKAFEALKDAYQQGLSYVIFTHGHSTSRPGQTTARSQIRKLMRSKSATPYMIRSESIQHESVFVAAIRRRLDA